MALTFVTKGLGPSLETILVMLLAPAEDDGHLGEDDIVPDVLSCGIAPAIEQMDCVRMEDG